MRSDGERIKRAAVPAYNHGGPSCTASLLDSKESFSWSKPTSASDRNPVFL